MTYRMWKMGAIGEYWATPGQWQRRLWDESALPPRASCPLLAALKRLPGK